MSRAEKDSDIVYELVSSKYKIAERNRLAKLRFLTQMNGGGSGKDGTGSAMTRRDSEPSLANVEKSDARRIDLSVPGTPVSSRYLALLGHARRNKNVIDSDSENEDYDGDDEKSSTVGASFDPSELSGRLAEELKIFTNEMDKLNQAKSDNSSSCDPLKKYFEDSDRQRTYRRDFSEVVGDFPLKKKVEPKIVKKVDKYFAESTKLNSFKREFNDVVGNFDPKNPSGREQFVDLAKIGTPISSRLIAMTKLLSSAENDVKPSEDTPATISGDVDVKVSETSQVQAETTVGGVENKTESCVNDDVSAETMAEDGNKLVELVPSVKIESPIEIVSGNGAENNNELIIMNDCEVSRGSVEIESRSKDNNNASEGRLSSAHDDDADNIQVDAVVEENKNNDDNEKVESNQTKQPQRLKRSDSAASDISIPGTPVSSRHLPAALQRSRHTSDTDDSGSETTEGVTKTENMEIAAMAKEFVNEIECWVQKSFDIDADKQEIALNDVPATAENFMADFPGANDANVGNDEEGGADEKLIIHEDAAVAVVANKVNNYFVESKAKDKSFSRTFSEIEQFNEAPYVPAKDVKARVDQYFQESERRGSLKRPFSQVIDYLPQPKLRDTLLSNAVKPGTPVSSKDMNISCENSKAKEVESGNMPDSEYLKGQEILRKAQEAIESAKKKFTVNEYFEESEERQTYRRNFSELQHDNNTVDGVADNKNPNIEKYFENSDAQKSFQRTFSEAAQELEPSVVEILAPQREKPFHYQRSSRASSISSNCSDNASEIDCPLTGRKIKKHGKKYGIDKYFATSLYRTAYHRSTSRRQSTEAAEGGGEDLSNLAIVEDEVVFGETELLSRSEFQHDDETRVTDGPNDTNGNQTTQFWREFLKPYNLNLQSEITITKEEFMNNNRTLE